MIAVAVVAAGAMGSAVGRQLAKHGCKVLTNLDGRSEDSRRRAKECGMEEASYIRIREEADYLLSILPPSHAFSFAESFLQQTAAGGFDRKKKDSLIFADCNAVNPATVKRIGTLFASESTPFVDAGIIGGPPTEKYNPTIYASATDKEALERFGSLSQYGLEISLIKEGGGIGDASALKMSYAGMTKGTTALFTTMILAAQASSPATTEALLNELRASQPEFLARISHAIPGMLPKAYRWVGEMEEIAGFIEGPESETYRGIAKLYERIEKSVEEDTDDIAVLRRFAEAEYTIKADLNVGACSEPSSSAAAASVPSLSSSSSCLSSSATSSMTDSSSPPAQPSITVTRQPSSASTSSHTKGKAPDQNGRHVGSPQKPSTSLRSRPSKSSTPAPDESKWGSNFWVTLVDPQTQNSFYACPATGDVSWDPPVGNFVLPPSTEGEWWELSDDSRGGLPYYYHTKSGETVWERPEGFVIPLGIIQNTALGRRLSNRVSRALDDPLSNNSTPDKTRRSEVVEMRKSQSHSPSTKYTNGSSSKKNPGIRRSYSSDQHHNGSLRLQTAHLPPIPGSPYVTDASSVSSGEKQPPATPVSADRPKSSKGSSNESKNSPNSITRSRSKSSSYVSHRPQPPQSLNAAVELLTSSQSDSGYASPGSKTSTQSDGDKSSNLPGLISLRPGTATTTDSSKRAVPKSPRRPVPDIPKGRTVSGPTIAGKEISAPILNHAATLDMSPVKNRAAGQPIPVEHHVPIHPTPASTLSTGTYPALPQELASDIMQFSESDFARQYFSTHRTGFIFRRRVPVAQLMTWQKSPLSSPLLTLNNRGLNRDAVKVFKVIQHIMGDRDRDRPVGVRSPSESTSTVQSINGSSTSLNGQSNLLDEERWLLGAGLSHGELRDEIYCQVMKQLTKNPNPESVFKGWQLLCVLLITFPPSKNFETYLNSFMQQHTTHTEGRVDIMAKFCLRRLATISKKGPRGKPPTIAEIETASDAAFNPSTFGESLDAIIRLQERTYPQQKVPIILPFLADGILALGGTKSEGIFRVPGDGDSISELKLRIDRGYYNLEGVDDPNILASLMKLWLRELLDPLVPEEMYNECVTNSQDPDACVHIVQRLPTINRRVVLFVISFLQLFLEEKVQSNTKMTPANLALVMAPNLLRCKSDSMAVVFTNAQYEQIFVYNLLLHLKCSEIDSSYKPAHGLGAVKPTPAPRTSKSKTRRQHS